MSEYDELRATIAAVRSATDIRIPSANELAEGRREVRDALRVAGMTEIAAGKLAARLASATLQFADACTSANLAAFHLAEALRDIEKMTGA